MNYRKIHPWFSGTLYATDNISFVVPSSWILDSGPYTLPV